MSYHRRCAGQNRPTTTYTRPSMICELTTQEGLYYTGTIWYQGKQLTRDQAAAVVNDALDQYAANPSNTYPVMEVLTVHDGSTGFPVAFWRIVKLTAI